MERDADNLYTKSIGNIIPAVDISGDVTLDWRMSKMETMR